MMDLTVPAWMDAAVCAQVDGELFFPEKGKSAREAQRICNGCDVRKECLTFAVKTGQRFGVWGGKSEREIRKIRRIA